MPATDSIRPKDWHAILNARQAIRNLRKIIPAQLLAGDGNLEAFIKDGLSPIKIEGTMIRAITSQEMRFKERI